MSDSQAHYRKIWDDFWGDLSDDPEDVLWNVAHDEAAELDFAHFQDIVTKNNRPLLDLGCGDGSQTAFFAPHFSHVIGVDVSSEAIDIAKEMHSAPGVDYRVLNVLNRDECQQLHDEHGDMNIYIRGVLMQFTPEERKIAAGNLQHLMGDAGYLYVNEYVPQTKAYYENLFKSQGMPGGFQRVIKSGIKPGGITRDEMLALFPPETFTIVREGEHTMNTIIPLKDGGYAQAPAFYMLINRR